MKMTLAQHWEFGEKIKQFREVMMQRHVTNIGTRASRESRATASVLKKLDHMKNVLDSLVCRDYPECEEATQIYYGKPSSLTPSAFWLKANSHEYKKLY